MMSYRLIRSRRRKKTISLRINHQGEVIVRAPLRTKISTINNFIDKKSSWIEKTTKSVMSKPPLTKLSRPQFSKQSLLLSTYINTVINKYAKDINVSFRSFEVKNVTSYWGNCTKDNRLNFNVNLINYPKSTINYVIIHELCHIKIKGHSRQFWELVKSNSPDYKKHILNLRKRH